MLKGCENLKLREKEVLIYSNADDTNPSKVIIKIYDYIQKNELDVLQKGLSNFYKEFDEVEKEKLDKMRVDIMIKQEANKDYSLLDYIKEHPDLVTLFSDKKLKDDVKAIDFVNYLFETKVKTLLYSVISIDGKPFTREWAELLIQDTDSEFALNNIALEIAQLNNEKIVGDAVKN